ncbi:MAG: M17 family peptidase N-terminal domain-containing protein, partial [Anaerolineae bacterium]|nr:M17 family peptidase N-terminal domain-containing protein [Anaerolineae bacterium]
MNIHTHCDAIEKISTPALVISVFENAQLNNIATVVDRIIGGQIQDLLDSQDFHGKRNEIAIIYPHLPNFAQRIILVGLGQVDQFTSDIVRQASSTAMQQVRKMGIVAFHTVVHGLETGSVSPQQSAEALVEGALLGAYQFLELKTKPAENAEKPENITLIVDNADCEHVMTGAAYGQILAESTILARNLVNRPGNIANPSHMAETARNLAKSTSLKC